MAKPSSGRKRNRVRSSTRGAARRDLRIESLEDRRLLATYKLVVTEINYNPAHQVAPGSIDENLYEFIELYNADVASINLQGVTVGGEAGTCPKFLVTLPNFQLDPGEYAVVVRDTTSFRARYGDGPRIAASYTVNNPCGEDNNLGGLPDSSSSTTPARVRVSTPTSINPTVTLVAYDDGGDFPGRPDGEGVTLVLDDYRGVSNATAAAAANAFYANADNWRSSEEYGGSPGRLGLENHTPRVIINEVLSNSNNATGERDTIELANISNDPVDISGWMLTDNENDDVIVGGTEYSILHAYFIPEGTILQPGGYFVVDESHFNTPSTSPSSFGLSSTPSTAGEPAGSVYLISREADGVTRLYEDGITFDATRTSQSIGRAPNLTGSFWPLTTKTFGSANSEHVASPVVITEIMYKRSPAATNLNYIELYNRTGSTVPLGGTNPWEVQGVSFAFSTGTPVVSILPGEAILIVPFAPGTAAAPTVAANTFRNTYGLDSTVRLFGPFGNNATLSDNGERLTLLQPYLDGFTHTDVLADVVDFDSESPWPAAPNGGLPFGAPNGTEYSLQRVSLTNIGDLPHSWRGALPDPGEYSPVSLNSLLEGIVVSELMYDPVAANFDANGDPLPANHLEFIEILNTTGTTKTLTNAGIGQGVTYRFPAGTTIAANERLVVVPFDPASATSQRNDFFSRYGLPDANVRLFGPWTGTLSNGGDSIGLFDGVGNTFLEFTYNNRGGWPERADEGGSSLELIDPVAVPEGILFTAPWLNDPTRWRASIDVHGSPGVAGSTPGAPSIVINEVNSHTDPRFSDAVEIYNIGSTPVDISEWMITDSMDDPSHYSYLPFMTLQPGEYITFDVCVPGNTCEGGILNFNIDAAQGDEIYLVSAVGLSLDKFVDQVQVPATFGDEVNFGGVSQGRWPNGTGELFPMESRTISQFNTTPQPGNVYTNGANAGPLVYDVVISEIMYNPSGANPNDFEYIELHNRLPFQSVNLGPKDEPDGGVGWPVPPEGWMIRGLVDFEFNTSHEIPPNGTIVVVGFNPDTDTAKATAFRNRYGIGAGVKLVGPFELTRPISDDGGEIRLEANDFSPLVITDPALRDTPNILVDRVVFDDVAPWPTSADGGGQSLTRTSATAFGNFAASWTGATPSPGSFSTSTPTGGPVVTGVVLTGSTWPAAFKTAVTTAGSPVQGYTVPKGAQQANALPWSGVNQVSITFDRAVTIASDALVINGVNPTTYAVSATPTNPVGNTYTWTITTPITGDKLNLVLDDAKVTASGAMLDGEWSDNVTTGNSGNGSAGGDFRFRVNVLPGDADGNGSVQQADYGAVRSAMFTRPGTGSYVARRDLNADGKISMLDAIVWRNTLGRALPAGNPASPAAPDSVVAVANRAVRRSDSDAVRAVVRAELIDRADLVDQAIVDPLAISAASGGGDAGSVLETATLRARRALRR
jgi:hypothetical protein